MIVVVFGSREGVSVAVEESPQTVIGVYIDLRALFAVGNGLGQVLRPDGESLTTAETGAAKSGYTSVGVAVSASRC